MDTPRQHGQLLSPYRVLDLTDEKGLLCAKVLGDLGADVIKIERPGGDQARHIGPFYGDIPHPERSLFWFAFNSSKRGITLDIEAPEGREIFKKLVEKADFVVESFPPGHMDSLGLGYSAISLINPRAIMTSISPFGQAGPHSHYQSSDLVAMAMGGVSYVWGDPDSVPVRCSVEQAFCQAGVQAAAGTMIAHYHRQLTGEGQHVDVSMQECIVSLPWLIQQYWYLEKTIVRRAGAWLIRGDYKRKYIYPCKDGYVSWMLGTARLGRRTRALVEWMDSEGLAEGLTSVNWEESDFAEVRDEDQEAWNEVFTKFFLTHTKKELYEGSLTRGIMLFPVNAIPDILESTQLEDRDFWAQVEHPELGASFSYPGAPFISSRTAWSISHRAPLIGEHNREIYEDELGLSCREVAILREKNVI